MRRIALVVAIAVLCLSPSTLLAHTRLLRSEPAAGTTVNESPRRITLVFSEVPDLALTAMRLETLSGRRISLDALRHDSTDAHIVIAAIPSTLEEGSYRVTWSVASRDGHPVRGVIQFAVEPVRDSMYVRSGEPPASQRMDEEVDQPPMAVLGALGFIGARWLSFISLFIIIGAVVFRFVVLRRASPNEADAFTHMASTNAATMGMVAAIGVLLSCLLKLARESADMPDIAVSSLVFGSTWGWALLLQLIGSLVAAIAFRGAHRPEQTQRRMAWRIALVAAAVLAVTPSLAGHAIADDLAFIAVPVDVVHMLAGSAWLGTLSVLVVVGISAALKTPDATRPGARVAALVNVFSPLALMCGASVIVTGIASSLLQLPRLDALWTTPYGVVLVVKLVFVAMLFAAGAWNWRKLRPRLTGDDAVMPLRSLASFELLLGTVVLGVTAVLVALELP